jgi:hypothetical protein
MDFKDLVFESFLREKFEIVPIEYGTDLIDKEWKNIEDNIYTTFFRIGITIYACCFVVTDTYTTVNFSVNLSSRKLMNATNEEFKNYIDSVDSFKKYKVHFNFNRNPTYNFISIIGNVMFLMKEGAKYFNSEWLQFRGADNELIKLYKGMSKNKSFIREFNNIGFDVSYDDRYDAVNITKRK